jgi:hypothetical protein
MSHSPISAGHAQPNEMSSLETRLASLEARFANSWATQTRDEYEKGIKEQCKQDILNYLRTAVIAAALFVLGAGYVTVNALLKATTIQVFEDRNATLSKEVREKADTEIRKEIARELKEERWSRFHTTGVEYRYLAQNYKDLYDNIKVPNAEKLRFYNRTFYWANDYYQRALAELPKAATYYERAQLHYKLAKQFKLSDWIIPRQALDDYNSAVQYYDNEEIQQGWRADAYLEMGLIYLEWALSSNQPSERQSNLHKSFDYLLKAEQDYERSQQTPHVQDGSKNTSKVLKFFLPDGSLSGKKDETALRNLLVSGL